MAIPSKAILAQTIPYIGAFTSLQWSRRRRSEAEVGGAAIQGAAIQGAAIQGAVIQGAAIQGAVIQGAAIQGAAIQMAAIQINQMHETNSKTIIQKHSYNHSFRAY